MACARVAAGARQSPHSAMRLQLRNNLHWCDCAGRAVFLDVGADRYFCLPKLANDAFLRLAAGEVKPGDSDHLHLMVARDLLVEAPQCTRLHSPPRVDSPTSDFLLEPAPWPGLLPMVRALTSQLHVAWLLRTRPLQQVIAIALNQRSLRVRASRDPAEALKAIAGAASASAFLLRAHNRCLVRAFSVQKLCHRIGVRPKLVVGVIAHPFAAHCWVQLGSAVLVGGFEQARLYTPILVLE